ncbi:MAG: rhomboid family intramembrane serine protease [Ginsengibacter sp.]
MPTTITITLIIIIITVLVSIAGFRSDKVIDDLIFYPPAVTQRKQYYRFITCGFIHADIGHLFFNMYAFYLFGNITEEIFAGIFGDAGKLLYVVLYVLALIVCLIPSYLQNRNNPNYRSLGASGAVSAVVFAYIMFNPMGGVGLIFIPVFIPGFLFGIIYLVVSYFLDKKGGGRINHSAHIWGAIFGIVFIIIASELFSTYPLLQHFIDAVTHLDPSKIFTTR